MNVTLTIDQARIIETALKNATADAPFNSKVRADYSTALSILSTVINASPITNRTGAPAFGEFMSKRN